MILKYFSQSSIYFLPKVNNPRKFSQYHLTLFKKQNNFLTVEFEIGAYSTKPDLPQSITICQREKHFNDFMLAQEIIYYIKKPNSGSNVVIKLDMAKTYGKVSWSYIFIVLRKMGINEVFIDMVLTIIANNWYSIINGKRQGFFNSTRVVKQGDPLSPTLFILVTEELSRSLNILHNDPNYHDFFIEMRGLQVNHIRFAYDIINFTLGKKFLDLVMQTLHIHEEISSQMINKDKSHFLIHSNSFKNTRVRFTKITGFKQKEGPITYL